MSPFASDLEPSIVFGPRRHKNNFILRASLVVSLLIIKGIFKYPFRYIFNIKRRVFLNFFYEDYFRCLPIK